MCFTVAYLERKAEQYAKRYKHALPLWSGEINFELPNFYLVSGFSHPKLPVVKHDGVFLFEWGLIPHWAKDENYAFEIRDRTLNAMSETAFEKPSYRKAVATQRCILGVSGFFEWRSFQKNKYPYFIHESDHQLFSLGCIYDEWINKSSGEIHQSFSIITTKANPLLEQIHNEKKRMPLILSRDEEAAWINPSLSRNEVEQLMKPYQGKDISAYTLSKAASSTRHDRNVPEILNPVNYEELEALL